MMTEFSIWAISAIYTDSKKIQSIYNRFEIHQSNLLIKNIKFILLA